MKKNTIAVLPFKNISSDEQNEFFSDGITEEIINALSKIDSLNVISRTSSFYFKDKNLPLRQISEELKANILLEGSTRIYGEQVRITASLIDAENDSGFWSESWDRKMENIFEIQDEVSLVIADKIREQFGHMEIDEHLVEKQTESLDAYQYALKARYHFNKWNPQDVKLSIDLFEKALELDPNHTESVVGLADAYSFMATTQFMPREEAWMKSVEYTQMAYQLDDQNAGVHYLLANMSFFGDCNYKEAGQHAAKSIELKPSYPEAQQYMAFLYILNDEMDKALYHLNIALATDPLNQETLFYKAYYNYRKGDFSESQTILNSLLQKNPKNIPAYVVKVYNLIMMEEYDEALNVLESVAEEIIIPIEKMGMLCLMHIRKGEIEEAQKILSELKLKSQDPTAHQAHSYLYLAYVNFGEYDKALDWLEEAIEMKSSVLMLSFSDSLAHQVKKTSRYQQIKSKIYQKFDSIEEIKNEKPALLDDEMAELYAKSLQKHMIEEEAFLIPNLSLRSLANQLEIHPNKLSWLLNEKLQKNFNEFVNHYRIEYFKKLYLNPENNHISIVGLAYESGFNSKTVFNTYFKKETGMTPKAFLKQNLA